VSTISLDDILFTHWIWQGQFDGDEFDQLAKDAVYYESPHHLMRVEDSIHYKALVSDDYTTYKRFCETAAEGEEHSEEKFRELKRNFNFDLLLTHRIGLNWHEKTNKYVVAGGRHRLSILKLYTDVLPRNIFIMCEGYLPR